ncbi:MAG: GNAT family N-acetyltransferase [Varibaculum sp.]|nr:GNAT family N-acetyltransferase [Varibaculum sp.]
MEIRIRLATPADLPDILTVTDQAQVVFHEMGIDQWDRPDYPDADIVNDIAAGQSWVAIANIPERHLDTAEQIVGTMACYLGGEGLYVDPDLHWQYPESDSTAVHRFAVLTEATGQGVARAMLDTAQKLAGHVRIDTHPGNKKMQGVLVHLGFRHVGDVYYPIPGEQRRLCYER